MVTLIRMACFILGGILIAIGALGGGAIIVSLFYPGLLFIEGRLVMLAAAGAVELAGVLLVFLSRIGVRLPAHDTQRDTRVGR